MQKLPKSVAPTLEVQIAFVWEQLPENWYMEFSPVNCQIPLFTCYQIPLLLHLQNEGPDVAAETPENNIHQSK